MKYVIPLICWALISVSCLADDTQKIGINEHLNEYLPKHIEVININGDTVILSSVINNKPTVLNFVYYRCPGICTPLMDGLAEVINLSDMQLGQDYQVVTISFDYTESTELAAKKRNNYSLVVKKDGMEKGWLFFTADSSNVAQLTQATGFSYKKTGNDYIHTAGLILLSPDGKITRYLNGTYFLPFEFKLAVIEASKGIPGPTVNKILQFCYSYDPVGQAYVLNITKVAGILIIIIAGLVWLVLTIKPKRRSIKS
ncbi:SCO family protein [Carboxylicivirga sediminis]|uniref:SCO family protein n=1 Tax=Carboxylicivirga sediminis TaxID=2006564 RepID=A0A941FC20_9BACT|nr:SCO family protein [Carboxylicivirga sediminis]MBR8538040.1 SCO family protein [Carboxylicivirga sediminis]